jgi:hypothetical protein
LILRKRAKCEPHPFTGGDTLPGIFSSRYSKRGTRHAAGYAHLQGVPLHLPKMIIAIVDAASSPDILTATEISFATKQAIASLRTYRSAPP